MDLAYNKSSLNTKEILIYKFDVPAANIMLRWKKVTTSVIIQIVILFSFS